MRVKFCGITNLDDAHEAVRLGAWAIGLNHHRDSPRFCEPTVAAEIGGTLRRQLEIVGVFVNPTLGELDTAAQNESLTILQLHGDEGPAFCQEAARRTGCKVIKALAVRSAADIQRAEGYRTDFHLLDAHRPGIPGGTGESFDWELLAARRSEVPLILAGGLTPDNVAAGVAAARPFAVDVASGVEAEPRGEDLAHTGAHKINNAIGQALLARRMGKPRVIAETGAGQHGVAAATACALLGLECVVYMGTEDIRRQAPNVERMRLLNADVVPVEAGARTLKEAVSAAIRDWVSNVRTTHYIIGSVVGPAPFPALVRDLQRVIGDEAREQALVAETELPARVIACVGGGANAIGTFYAFLAGPLELIGVDAGGEGIESGGDGACR